MPTVSFPLPYLQRLTPITPKTLADRAFYYGLEAALEPDQLTVDVTAERPDLLSAEGFTRAMNIYGGTERTVPDALPASGRTLKVLPPVLPLRPYIGALVVENITLDEAALASLVQFQEKVTHTFGRQRKKIAIGLYDLDQITGDVTYTAANRADVKLTPIGGQSALSAEAILTTHPNGRRYGSALAGHDSVPVLQDSRGQILSLPPIVNAAGVGEIKTTTQNLLVDVSGISQKTVCEMLNILAHNFLDTGATVKTVVIEHPHGTFTTPTLVRQVITFSAKTINEALGTAIAKQDLGLHLKRMDLMVKGTSQVHIPTYRTDIFSDVDVAGDLMVAIGTDNLQPEPTAIKFHLGSGLPLHDYVLRISDLARRMQLMEVKSFILTDPDILSLFEPSRLIAANAKSRTHSSVRGSLQPGILDILSHHISAPKPLNIYEIGQAVQSGADGTLYETFLWSFACLDARASFATAKSYVQTMLKALKVPYRLETCHENRYILGRAATLMVGEQNVGHFGEISPTLLAQFSFPEPVCSGEIDCQQLMQD
ncbi:MAG: phenylalanine--tRNA ligase subunit beta [Cyanobacteria bacterium J06627_15]